MKEVQAVFIESGHGKSNKLPWVKDPGVVRKMKFSDAIRGEYTETITEHDISKELAVMVVNLLKTKQELATAIVTGIGTSDAGASINQKVKYFRDVIQNNKLDASKTLGVSIHVNSGGGRGSEAFYDDMNPSGKEFAQSVIAAINKYTQWGFHGTDPVKPDTKNRLGQLYISDFTYGKKYCKYVLIEVCYIDNDKEINYLLNNKPRIAEAIASGIMDFIRA